MPLFPLFSQCREKIFFLKVTYHFTFRNSPSCTQHVRETSLTFSDLRARLSVTCSGHAGHRGPPGRPGGVIFRGTVFGNQKNPKNDEKWGFSDNQTGFSDHFGGQKWPFFVFLPKMLTAYPPDIFALGRPSPRGKNPPIYTVLNAPKNGVFGGVPPAARHRGGEHHPRPPARVFANSHGVLPARKREL